MGKKTRCRGKRFSCLRAYDGVNQDGIPNASSPTCIDNGFKNDPWVFPHQYMVVHLGIGEKEDS